METVHISVRGGVIQDAGSWLYAWLPAGRSDVVYVGGTGLPPVVRAWLHLHHDDPTVARVAHRYPEAATEPMEVIAFRLPEHVDRREAKAELIRQLHSRGKLAADYVGDQPDQGTAPAGLRDTIGAIVNRLVDVNK